MVAASLQALFALNSPRGSPIWEHSPVRNKSRNKQNCILQNLRNLFRFKVSKPQVIGLSFNNCWVTWGPGTHFPRCKKGKICKANARCKRHTGKFPKYEVRSQVRCFLLRPEPGFTSDVHVEHLSHRRPTLSLARKTTSTKMKMMTQHILLCLGKTCVITAVRGGSTVPQTHVALRM